METAKRREAVRAYKERRTRIGIVSITCAPTGEAWVGASRNVDAQENGLRFGLRMGGHPNAALQKAWREHGEGAFAYAVVEVLDDEDLTPIGRDDLLKTQEAHWRERLGARRLFG